MVPKFTTKEVEPLETLGQKLKRIRENLKLSIEDIEKNTKIRKKYIISLESNDYQALPADVYVKGFLRNYAKVLGISEKKVIEFYEREKGILANVKKANKVSVDSSRYLKSPKVIITPKTIVLFLASVAAVMIIGYITYQIFILSSSPKLAVTYPLNNAVVSKNFLDIVGKTDIGAEVFINGQKVVTSEEGDFKVNVSIGQKGVNVIKITSRNPKNGRITEKITNIIAEIPDIAASPPLDGKAASPAVPINNSAVKAIIKIGPETAWISVKRDNKRDFEGLMLPGTSKEFDADQEISLTTGNAGSTEVILNGRSLGKMGKDREVKTGIIFDKNTKLE